MHSVATIVSNTAAQSEPPSEYCHLSTQHGIQRDHRPSLPSFSEDGEEGFTSDSSAKTTSISSTPSREISAFSTGDTGLNPPPVPPSFGDRITEYEKSGKPVLGKNIEERLFQVIKSQKKSSNLTCAIANIPNEILTHVVSFLPAEDMSVAGLVSRRFHEIVTSPHGWRAAFSRYFPGNTIVNSSKHVSTQDGADDDGPSAQRVFSRLSALSSWRSEYILRSRLLQCLVRGRPLEGTVSSLPGRHSHEVAIRDHTTYDARMIPTNLHASWDKSLNKNCVRLVHGNSILGDAFRSDPAIGKLEEWGVADLWRTFLNSSDSFPGVAMWGLGPGEVIVCPNVMDLSNVYGAIYGECVPGGSVYFRSIEKKRGLYLDSSAVGPGMTRLGVPEMGLENESICAVWIAKSDSIPSLSKGLIGMLSGSSSGIVTAYSIGGAAARASRVSQGDVTARWVLSPGVPIISLAIDEDYSFKRHAQNRIWAVALNALGEVFYLTKFPSKATPITELHSSIIPWLTGRSVCWNIVELSRREATPNPYKDPGYDGSYSPRSSWDGMCLSEDQIHAETREIQQFIEKPPIYFRSSCLGWDMRRRLEIDFAGDDGNLAGESIIVFRCGLDEESSVSVNRLTRLRIKQKEQDLAKQPGLKEAYSRVSLFGGSTSNDGETSTSNTDTQGRQSSIDLQPDTSNFVEEWRCSKLTFNHSNYVQLSSTAIDSSSFVTVTLSEDPALGFSTASTASSPFGSPQSLNSQPGAISDIPGQRARFVAAGTKTGCVFIWNIRAPISPSSHIINNIEPVRIIYTASPDVTSLALTSLYVVHGGSDGLVQAWDPLASTLEPIRTIYSARTSRRIAGRHTQFQAQSATITVGAICLDPDPTVLRGIVAVGHYIRYWGYSSSTLEQYKGRKRKLRVSPNAPRGGQNSSGHHPSDMKAMLAAEKAEMEEQQKELRRQANHLAGRFGTDLLNNEDEALAYATLLSQESWSEEQQRQSESSVAGNSTPSSSKQPLETPATSPSHATLDNDEDNFDSDMVKAIQLSLQENDNASVPNQNALFYSPEEDNFGYTIKYSKAKRSPKRTAWSPDTGSSGGPSDDALAADLELALKLSLEDQAIYAAIKDDEKFPEFAFRDGSKSNNKSKGKERAKIN